MVEVGLVGPEGRVGWAESPRSLDRLGAGTDIVASFPGKVAPACYWTTSCRAWSSMPTTWREAGGGATTGLPGGETQAEWLCSTKFLPFSETLDAFPEFSFRDSLCRFLPHPAHNSLANPQNPALSHLATVNPFLALDHVFHSVSK